jgi:hypothetical protein
MKNDDTPSAAATEPPADAADVVNATSTTNDEGGCGLEAFGVGLIGFGVLISIAIPVVIIVGWIPVVIGALVLRHAKRRNANAADAG